jgi:PAS domain S-box-containing protein
MDYLKFYEGAGNISNSSWIGGDALETIRKVVNSNGAVGVIAGYYDERLSILSVSDFLLNNLGYSHEEFQSYTKGSLKALFCGENNSFLEPDCFPDIHGMGEGEMLTQDGTPVIVRLFKEDSTDSKGTPIWIISVRIDWEHENVMLVNEVIKSGLWYFDCDQNGEIREVHWSHAFRKMLGFHSISDFPNELSSWSDLLHPADRDKTLKSLREAIEDKTNKKKYDVEYRLKMQDGNYQWFRANAEIVRRTNGTARRITGIFININNEKKAAMQQKKSDAFHHAFTKTNLCEYYVDLNENTFESMKVEPSLMTIFEKSNTWDQLIREFIDNYVCEEYKQEVKQFYARDYIAKRLGKIDGELSLECCIILNGEKRWVRNVVFRGEIERSQYAIIFLRDITDAKREAELQKQVSADNEAMGHLLQSVTRLVDHFAICDLENDRYEYSMINIKAGYPPRGKYSDLIKMVTAKFQTMSPLEKMDTLLTARNLRANLSDENDIYKFEYCTFEEDCYRNATIIPLEWKGRILTKVLWVSMDITQEKRQEIEGRKALKDAYEAAERANRAKTEFLTNMSHDIRTPMNAIVGLTAIAGASIQQQDKVLECLGKITKASRHLLGLINEVLDMARIESGRVSLVEEEFNFSELVENLVALVKPGIDEHNHNFEVHVKNIEHEDVCGDTMRIQQVFTNLMSNAIKYTPDGGNIIFSIEEKTNNQSELGCYEFCIEDNGIGMDEDFQKIMFQPFTRADDKRTTKIQGTGLGMAITNNIINMMNGDIRVKSVPNQGTKIMVTIFLRLQDKGADRIKELENLPVLVVDDDEICCESTVTTLKEIGIAGEWVTTGEEAIARVMERHDMNNDYFAIIMDWKLPKMDGIEATRQIRKRVGKEVTIIVLTSYDYSEIEEEARAAGVDAFIAKPLFRSRLAATFKQIINGRPDQTAKDYLRDIKNSNYSDARILLVEDNELNREIATEIISMTGAEIDTAENGKEAVEIIEGCPEDWYDLVFMDIQMPVMNGYETTAAIRALPGKRGQLPIIAMTANAFAEDVQMAKNTGMNEHIAKPLDFDKLNTILWRFLK